MHHSNSVKPEDILADGIDTTTINGKLVRKGSVAAFLANIELLESSTTSEQQKEAALNMLKELASVIVATGLHKHAIFKNAEIEKILINAQIHGEV